MVTTRLTKIAQMQSDMQLRLKPHGNHWIPTHARLLGIPSPLSSETFSSWFWRISLHHRIAPKHLLAALGVQTSPAWVDVGKETINIGRIASVAMVPVDEIDGFTWAETSLLSNPEFNFLSHSGLKHQPQPIYRYCASCLDSDEIPFVRRLWRLGFVYICPAHHCILRDHCPHCGELFDLTLSGINKSRSMQFCRKCRKDITQVSSAYLPEHLHYWVVARQSELLRLLSCSLPKQTSDYWHPPCNISDYSLDTHKQIDPFSETNARNLFGQLMRCSAQREISSISAEEAARKLRQSGFSLNIRGHRGKIRSITMLNGIALFHRYAPEISIHIRKCQKMRGGTFWGKHALLGLSPWVDAFAMEALPC